MKKVRLDHLLVSRGLAESGAKAQALILAGKVRIPGMQNLKPGLNVPEEVIVELLEGVKYVSRGGEKLAGALDTFKMDPAGLNCMDVGASTGGFTDCLLQRGATKVFAIDVGTHQLHEKLRNDPRVISKEQIHILKITKEDVASVFIPSPLRGEGQGEGGRGPSLVVMDVSFISVEKILPHLATLTQPNTDFLVLVKPQFEVGPKLAPKGVVRDHAVRLEALRKISEALPAWGFRKTGECTSPITGPEGNVEFFLRATRL